MSDLVAFVNARIDEDEATATNAPMIPLHPEDFGAKGDGFTDDTAAFQAAARAAAFGTRFDPARVLREVAADRELIAAYENVAEFSDPWIGLDLAVRIRARRFSDHPDYDPAWTPEVTG